MRNCNLWNSILHEAPRFSIGTNLIRKGDFPPFHFSSFYGCIFFSRKKFMEQRICWREPTNKTGVEFQKCSHKFGNAPRIFKMHPRFLKRTENFQSATKIYQNAIRISEMQYTKNLQNTLHWKNWIFSVG